MSIYLTSLIAEKLRSTVKARGGGSVKYHFLNFHISDRAAADRQVEKKQFLNYEVKTLKILLNSHFFEMVKLIIQ